jgi:DNA gyrase inhibitor GyrI
MQKKVAHDFRYDLCSYISDSEYSSDSEINVKISSGGEQSVSSDEAQNISNSSSMQPDVWANSGTE